MFKKKSLLLIIFFALTFFVNKIGYCKPSHKRVRIAIEFVAHAACAHIAKAKKWYQKAGINITSFDNYITGMALASALSNSNIDAAYLCLIPAIVAYANGGVKIKVVSGTHKYGYGLIVNPKKVKTVYDLLKPNIRIACPREGSPTDAIMQKMIDKYHLDRKKLNKKVLRMPPPKVLFALEAGQIDAGFCCEQFPSMGVGKGFKELLSARELWPDMQGSVLIVTEKLIKNHPNTVKELVNITKKTTAYIKTHPNEASKITAQALTVTSKEILPFKISNLAKRLKITPTAVHRALFQQMKCSTDINVKMVQQEINYLYNLGYIKKKFNAKEILDLRFLK